MVPNYVDRLREVLNIIRKLEVGQASAVVEAELEEIERELYDFANKATVRAFRQEVDRRSGQDRRQAELPVAMDRRRRTRP